MLRADGGYNVYYNKDLYVHTQTHTHRNTHTDTHTQTHTHTGTHTDPPLGWEANVQGLWNIMYL